MKLIIAGGRNYQLTEQDIEFLRALHSRLTISEIVLGGAEGTNKEGEDFARDMSIPIKRFKGDWSKYGKSAGYMRNKQMALYADSAVLFPGGERISKVRIEALKAGLSVYDWSHEGAVE